MSGSSATTSSTQQQLTSTQNVQGGSGLTFAGSNNVVKVMDPGAVQAAVEINKAAQQTAQAGIYGGEVVFNSGLDHATAAYQSSLTLGHDAIQAVTDIASAAAAANSRITSNAVTSLSAVAQQNSESQGTQVTATVRTIAIAGAVAFGLYAMSKTP